MIQFAVYNINNTAREDSGSTTAAFKIVKRNQMKTNTSY